jgi:hypothetical protein
MKVSDQSHAPAALPAAHWTAGWVGLRACLNAVEKRKIFCLCQELNSDSSVVKPLAYRYTD